MFARTANSKARRRLVEQEDDGIHAEPIQRDSLAFQSSSSDSPGIFHMGIRVSVKVEDVCCR